MCTGRGVLDRQPHSGTEEVVTGERLPSNWRVQMGGGTLVGVVY